VKNRLEKFAFIFNLRRCMKEAKATTALMSFGSAAAAHAGAELLLAHAVAPGAGQVMLQALAVESLVVGRCRLTASKPVLKAPMISALDGTV
jgi:hypothetical protein